MFGELNYKCPQCETELFRTDSCKQLILTCHKCGASHMINASTEEIVIKIRPPKEKRTDKVKTEQYN